MQTAPGSRVTDASAPPASCYLCGGSELRLRFPARRPSDGADAATYRCTNFGHRLHQAIWACTTCGLLTQWPRPTDQELIDAYRSVEDPHYVSEKDNRYLTFSRVVRRLGPPRQRRLLDVGAYCGYFVDVAARTGFRAEGLELSAWAADEARGLGLPMHCETLAQRAEHGATYELITMWDVVEHMADPRAELAQARRLLEPNGTLYLSTIDAGSPTARMLGGRWPWLMEMHLHYFDRRTLPRLLADTGFRVLDISTYTHVVSARYLLEKVEAAFPGLAPAARLARRMTPARLRVPTNLGDNMLVVATTA